MAADRIGSCECGRVTCPRSGSHEHYRALSRAEGGNSVCQTPAEFCARWGSAFGKPIGSVQEAIVKCLEHFATSHPDVSADEFETLLRQQADVRHRHADEDGHDHDDVDGTVAMYILGKWLDFYRSCEVAQQALTRSGLPGWALYAFGHGGVCDHFADDPRRFCAALARLVPRYTLPERITEAGWLYTLRLLGDPASTEALWASAQRQHRELEHLMTSWTAYRAAWETHVCGRHEPCGPLPSDQSPYDAQDAYWETLNEISQQIGHRVHHES